MSRTDVDDRLQTVVPAALRGRWLVLPRFFLSQLFAVGVLIGVGAGVSVVGLVHGDAWLAAALPIAIVAGMAQKLALSGVERRALEEARRELGSGED